MVAEAPLDQTEFGISPVPSASSGLFDALGDDPEPSAEDHVS
jgi:hypothetical protein